MNPYLTALLASGVIASLVTSIFNYVNLRQTNKRLLETEKLKNENSLLSFRYSELYEINKQLNELPVINYNFLENIEGQRVPNENLYKKVIEQSTDKFLKVEKLYNSSMSLFDRKSIEEVDKIFMEQAAANGKLIQSLHTGKEFDLTELLVVRAKAEEEFKKAISNQLRKLVNNNK